ncbi:hypothetical protein ACUN24_24330 [Pedobacter sp. WC2501]
MTSDFTLPQSTAISTSGLMHLKRFWGKVILRRVNQFDDEL